MFHTIISLAYILPNIYVFIRIWKLFINKGYRLHYTVIYLLLASIYPLSNFLNENVNGFIGIFLSVLANYILPFYLYLFLFVLLFDILLLINYLIRVVNTEIIRTTRFKSTALSMILILAVVVVLGGIVNFNTIRISEYTIDVPARKSKIDHLKIAFVADFHLKKDVNLHFVERFADKIKIINPELMIFGGDIVEGDRDDGNLVSFAEVISRIKTKYGVYAVLGNHEHYARQERGSFFDKAGMKILSDTNVVLANSFNLTGRNDSHIRTRKQIEDLLKLAVDTLPEILIDHRPLEIDQVSKTTVDVQLSGHTHNGQLFPINLITRKVYLLSWGHKKIGNTHFFVTSGIRLWGPPVRTTGKSEIMVIDINFINDGTKAQRLKSLKAN
jgi:predicted MPP superfamily phosphohydrolase